MKKLLITTVAAMALGITGAYAQDSGAAGADAAKNSGEDLAPMIEVGNAKIEDGKITGVTVTSPVKGYVVVHDDGAGAPPASLGHAAIDMGETGNLSIDLTEAPGDNVSLMLHEETNGNDTYDFGPGSTDVDTPVSTAAGVVNQPLQGM